MSVVLACDLGGTSMRAALVDVNGHSLHELAVPSPQGEASADWAQIDPQQWWDAFESLVAGLATSAGELMADVQAIAICGVTRTQLFLDEQGRSLRPAITWRDARAAELLPTLLASLPVDHPERSQVNAFHPLARLAWLRTHEPQVAAQLRSVIEPKDYLNFRLTGALASDPISSARLLASAQPGPQHGPSLLTAAGGDAKWLPRMVAPMSCMGMVSSGLAGPLAQWAGIPVMACSNDTWAAVAGLGALREGYAYNISGTTEVFGVMGAQAAVAPGLMTVTWGDGLYQVGGPGQNGADTVSWLLSLLSNAAAGDTSAAAAIEALLAGQRDAQPLLFLPYLQGERTPYWDADLRGAFVGLNRRHQRTDLAWAVIEGIGFLNRVVLERAEAALGIEVKEIRYGGGAAANARWCQVKADICGRPVWVGDASQPGIVGAAAIAWTGAGRFASFDEAQQALTSEGRRYEPDLARHASYSALFALFRQAESALAPISHGLAKSAYPGAA